jgi:hypothetical protein
VVKHRNGVRVDLSEAQNSGGVLSKYKDGDKLLAFKEASNQALPTFYESFFFQDGEGKMLRVINCGSDTATRTMNLTSLLLIAFLNGGHRQRHLCRLSFMRREKTSF